MSTGTSDAAQHERTALLAGIAAFGMWGIVPMYWKLLKRVPASEILAHRFVWTTVFLVVLLTWQRRWPVFFDAVRNRRAVFFCLTSGLMIAINWLCFIWAVNIDRVIETSLGYFMTPLVNVLFGALFLRERLTRMQLASVLLATAGVLNLTLGYGRFPSIALTLCISFGLYGLLRKKSGTSAMVGLFLETTLLTPFAIVYLLVLQRKAALVFNFGDAWLTVLIASTGIITGLPLVWFGHAARYLRLTTVGFLQYLSPSISLLLGVFLYHENFTRAHAITFTLIWIALAVFTWEAVTRWRLSRSEKMAATAIAGSTV